MKILFINPEKAFASMQFIVESIKAMAFKGYQIDILINEKHTPPFGFEHSNLSKYYFRNFGRIKGSYRISLLVEAIYLHRKNHYDLLIGASQSGLLVADFLRRFWGGKSVFYNDEIWFGNERSSKIGKALGICLKILERRANRQALLTITQDMKRARLLELVNKISIKDIMPLPNAMSGIAKKESACHYLYDRLNIPYDKKIILWLGGCSPGGGSQELASSADQLPEDCVLVFHFRSDISTQYQYKLCELADEKKVYISREMVPYDKLNNLIMSAFIGLGLYADKGVNSRCIFHSSGRINSYLRFGIPCIVSDFIGFHWIERDNAGVCVKNWQEVLPAIVKINNNYKKYSDAAVKTFNEHLNVDRALSNIFLELEKRVNFA